MRPSVLTKPIYRFEAWYIICGNKTKNRPHSPSILTTNPKEIISRYIDPSSGAIAILKRENNFIYYVRWGWKYYNHTAFQKAYYKLAWVKL